MLRLFRAYIHFIFNPGRCPGLVYNALSGLRNASSQFISIFYIFNKLKKHKTFRLMRKKNYGWLAS